MCTAPTALLHDRTDTELTGRDCVAAAATLALPDRPANTVIILQGALCMVAANDAVRWGAAPSTKDGSHAHGCDRADYRRDAKRSHRRTAHGA